jgi:hypothetical protein
MSKLVLSGDTSGSITLESPAVSGTTTLTLPTTSGTVITTGSIFAGTGPAFSAYQSSAQTGVASLTLTKLTFTTEEFDTNNNYASSRFTPTVAGYYQINAQVGMTSAATTATLLAFIYKNGASLKSGSVSTGTTFLYPQANVSAIVYCNGSTDYIEIYVYGTANGSSFSTYTGAENTYFQAALIRGA